jgi:hypothetical protein
MAEEQVGQAQEIERSASRLESELRAQIGRMQAATRTTLVVGIILFIVILVYLTFLTSWIKKEMAPEVLAETMESIATEQGLPRLEAAIIAQAPGAAQALREQVVSWIPLASKEVETRAMSIADNLTDRVDAVADDAVTKFLASQKTELKPLIEHASEPEASRELEELFTQSLDELVGRKMDELLLGFDRQMMFVDSRLTRFQLQDAELSPEEQFEKECDVRLMGFINEISKQAVQEIGAPAEIPAATPGG